MTSTPKMGVLVFGLFFRKKKQKKEVFVLKYSYGRE